ncbi:ATP-binding domain-containing protein [Salicola sp. Rm-C-2C1-2]|uniref:DEAD/DEAH box helicase n=1 Tax=Salicola sp. Rm-C-2C1-2 TaxID=3141321 RepID=UPI0032E504B9
MNEINFTKGVNNKPVASNELQEILSKVNDISGECFFGYPLVATPEGSYSIDASIISPEKGIILFDLVEGTEIGDYKSRQDDLINYVESKLKVHRELVVKRQLIPALEVVTFAPAINNIEDVGDDYYLANCSNLREILNEIEWESADPEIYKLTLSAMESLSSIRKSRSKREARDPESRGAKLKNLEDSIATLDHRQNKAVIEIVEDVQRIRGLAGSGKTIVLALKAAYIHTQYPNWRLAVTFQTRSLKGQFKRLINNFCIEQSGEEPDWTKVRILNAWGAPGGDERDGLYYEFCRTTGQNFFDFRSASKQFGGNDKAFDGACETALAAVSDYPDLYDVLLVDEAQDFDPSFLRLCYAMLGNPKRLIYAYDELQNLSGKSVPPPEEIFGKDDHGNPIVSLGLDNRRDVILEKCYRNSRPILVAAHALGFGIYRSPKANSELGLVQMFDEPGLWNEIGYETSSGSLDKGKDVVLSRSSRTSPEFLENHSEDSDIFYVDKFECEDDQNEWLVNQIEKNINEDELRHDDIIVIHPDPISARKKLGPIRKMLFERNIQSHLAGVDTMADVFFQTESPSITFTGIYRAKGNEAGMVYVINSQDCETSGVGLASLRNRLFTAITRSKAWIRVVGYGDNMDDLIAESRKLFHENFSLNFKYPTDKELEKLRVVHRDLSPDEKARLDSKKKGFEEAIQSIGSGELEVDDLEDALSQLDEAQKKKFLEALRGKDE